jgi:hypothetical protein
VGALLLSSEQIPSDQARVRRELEREKEEIEET